METCDKCGVEKAWTCPECGGCEWCCEFVVNNVDRSVHEEEADDDDSND